MGTLAIIDVIGSTLAAAHPLPPRLDVLMTTGFLCAFLATVFFIYQRESSAFVLFLSVSLAVLSFYGFLQGAWPLGWIAIIWSVSTLRRWRKITKTNRHHRPGLPRKLAWAHTDYELSRVGRMFGTGPYN
jgi:hypothetical protein